MFCFVFFSSQINFSWEFFLTTQFSLFQHQTKQVLCHSVEITWKHLPLHSWKLLLSYRVSRVQWNWHPVPEQDAHADLCLNLWVCTPFYTLPDPLLSFLMCLPTIKCSSKLPPWSGTLGNERGLCLGKKLPKNHCINMPMSSHTQDRHFWSSSHLRKTQGLTGDDYRKKLFCVLFFF